MREEVVEEVFGYNSDVAPDVVVQHKLRSNGRLVLPAATEAPLVRRSRSS